MQPMLTILTPTYNRSAYLPRCYDSLCSQTRYDFEWLIVDDGSTDGTMDIVSKWMTDKTRQFPVEYVKKTNGGKHSAINYAVKFIHGTIVLILDSDDYLTKDAVENVLNVWRDYSDDHKICGLSFLKGYDLETPLAKFEHEVFRSNHIDYRINKRISGDCCEIIRTKVLKEFPFPIFEGETFLGENYLWDNVALKYDTVYVNKVIYICEYLDGGLSKQGRALRMRNPYGGMETSRIEMDKRYCLSRRIKSAILYVCYGFAAKLSVKDIVRTSKHSFMVLLFWPFGRLLYLYWH